MNTTYGKFDSRGWDRQVIIELKHWFINLLEVLPKEISSMKGGAPKQFIDWMKVETRPYDFSNELLYTLPSPRYKFYEYQSFNRIQDHVTALTDEVSEALGFYHVVTDFSLLRYLKSNSY